MGRLRTLTILMSIGAWSAATQGAYQEGVPSPAPGSRPPAPAPPVEYLRAGAQLFNNGQYDLAAKYLKAAHDYRESLSEAEQARLDEYFRAMDVVAARQGGVPAQDAEVRPVGQPATAAAPAAGAAAPAEPDQLGRDYPTDSKSAARWLLVSAREDLARGDFDAAQAKVDKARVMDVKWGLFDEVTPNKLQKELDKAMPEGGPAAVAASAPPAGDPGQQKSAAKARLDEARAALAGGDYDRAQAIAQEVASWGLSFGVLEDSPEKVIAATRALRSQKSGASRNDQSTYDLLVSEARTMLQQGELDAADAKARHALRLDVVPTLDADRAEAVLHEVELARSGGGLATPTGDPEVVLTQNEVEVDPFAGAADPTAPAVIEMPPTFDEGEPAGMAVAVGEVPNADPAASELDNANSMLAGGNFAAAREAADRAVAAGAGAEAEDLKAQIDLAEQAASLQLYDAAMAAVREQEFERARALFNEVASMPSALDAEMAQRVQDMLMRLPQGADAAPAGGLEAQLDAATIEAQRLNAEVGTKVAESRRLMEVEPDQAITLLEETKASVEAAGLSAPVSRTMLRRLEVAIELAKKDKLSFDAKMADKEASADAKREKLRIYEADIAKQKQVAEMMEKAMASQNDGDYAAAEAWAERVIALDPNNVSATAMATVMRVKRHYEEDQRIRDAKEEGVLNALHDIDRSSVIDGDVLRNGIAYPRNFLEMTKDRGRFAEPEPYKAPETVEVERKLNEPISINMPDGSIGEAADFLRNYTGLNITIDTVALQDEALTEQTPVNNLILNDVKIKTVLRLMLEPHGLSYKIEDGVLIITTPQSKSRVFPRVYQVADLVVAPPRNPKPPQQLLNPINNSPAPQAQQDPNVLTTGGDTGGITTKVEQERDVDFGPLMQLITTSIEPTTWEIKDPNTGNSIRTGYGLGGGGFGGEGGGLGFGEEEPPIGSITPFFLNLSLIIRHTSEVHDQVIDLLRQLRRLQDLQVSVEVRFITVNDNFAEFIGVDFDFSIQSDLFGPKSSFVVPNPAAVPVVPGAGGGGGGGGGGGAAAAAPPYLVNPARDHSLGNRQPLVLGVGNSQPGVGTQRFTDNLQIPVLQDSFSPASGLLNLANPSAGTNFGIAFLSDLEVYLFMQAVQQNLRANVVQAPKVTTFNGATATIGDQTQRFLVTGLTPLVSNGAIAFQPQISPIQDGVTLNVTPVVTADRRYVRLTLQPFFQVISDVQTFTFGSGAVGGGGLGGGAANLQSTIQLPIVSNTFVITTVTVPDGGTVLMGGIKRLTEQRLEFGTPVLSKIPTINRLFRNVGIGRTSDSLMLMVTPRIIILEEEEERLGIPAVPVQGLP
ncbi:type II secretory pathway, component PulD [Tautonia plasticadhaerens]|uniref:Bacterial type II and III secretion system protein n=1 Tax=Tautonia plasticadhaerens TaxID=2527974 RepID=A0A518GZW7_9BACT|nr:type II secretory pathway, component PulD [Tautonia plasticadhaerens]QDV34128.1 Bacterial type II and III secretion system protein [Tautonia plasticadhaerens]